MPTATQPPLTPELLKVGQVAELLGVSAMTVWNLAKRGDLTPVRFLRCTRWRRADVERYIDGLSTSEASDA